MTHTRRAGAGAAASPAGTMTEDQFRALYERLRGQPSWGPDNRRGALHYLTPDVVLAAMREVKLGRTVSLAAPVEDWPAADNPDPVRHEMKGPLGADAGGGVSFGMDRIAMNIHGNADSHIDALCHVMFDGTLHNGLAADTVGENGAAELSIAVAADGIVGRGVLLDYLQFTELAATCAVTGRWSFLCVIAPLRLPPAPARRSTRSRSCSGSAAARSRSGPG